MKRFIAIDYGYAPNFWESLLVFFRIKKRTWDYTCMVSGYKDKKGIIHIDNVQYK